MFYRTTGIFICLAGFSGGPVLADAPNLQTPAPVIYLADNLDEADQLGWCIDTLGRGYAEQLQAHSCKPQGGDVQFTHLPASDQVQSVAFPDKCMTVVGGAVPLGLRDCDATDQAQKFSYTVDSGELRLQQDDTTCVSVGQSSRQAGPFMSRDLLLTSCADTDVSLRSWDVIE